MKHILILALIPLIFLSGCLSADKAGEIAGEVPSSNISIPGSALPVPALVVTPSTYSFGTRDLNVTTSHSFTVYNQGSSPASIDAVVLTGSMYSVTSETCEGATIAPQASCLVTVAFTPTLPGTFVAVISIDFQSDYSTVTNVTFNINGAGGVTQPSLTLSPSTYAFGNVATNVTSTAVFTVSNSTAVSAYGVTASVSGTDFVIHSQTCNGGNLSSGGSCTVTVRFQPSSATSRVGNLRLSYNSQQGLPYTSDAALTGTGVVPSVAFSFAGFDNPGTNVSSLTPTGAVLNWTAQPLASYYRIYRITPGPSIIIATVTNPATNSYPLTGLTPGQAYQYRINAFDAQDVSDGNANLASLTTPAGTGASFNGWTDVVATGSVESNVGAVDTALGNTPTGVAPAPPAWPASISDSLHIVSTGTVKQNAVVKLAWDPFTFTSGGLATSHVVYRGTSPGGPWTDITAVIGNVLSGNTFVDNNVSNETTYYYKVHPILGVELVPAVEFDQEIKVYVPPANMVLVHRWIANREVCTNLLGKTWPADFDRGNNYRCNHVWGRSSAVPGCADPSVADPSCNHAWAPQIPWDQKAYWDMGYSLIADRYEAGCKFSAMAGNKGSSLPGVGLGNDGDVYYGTNATATAKGDGGEPFGKCFIKVAGTWRNYVDGTATAAQHAQATTNEPGYPPATVNQGQAYNACQQRTVAGVGALRLWRRHELIAVRAWKGVHNNPTNFITNQLTSGVDHATNGSCNTRYGDGVPQTSAIIENVNVFMHLVTGSWATRNCYSRYELHDQIGNMNEWTGDQLYNCNVTNGCTFGAGAFDLGNIHLEDFPFNDVIGKTYEYGWVADLGYHHVNMIYGTIKNQTTMFPMFGVPAKAVDSLYGSTTISPTYMSQDYDFTGRFINILGALDGMGSSYGRFSMATTAPDYKAWAYDSTAPVYGHYQMFGYRCVREIP